MRVAAAILLAAAVCLAGWPPGGRSGVADALPPRYLSLGDSLAASMQPAPDGHDGPTSEGFSERVWGAQAAVSPHLTLVKLGRGGETASSMIKSPRPGPSQLELAEQHLRTGTVPLVTIDIGANEVESCARGSGFDQACVQSGLASLRQSLPRIISHLRAAGGPQLKIIGGPTGRRLALASVPVERAINATLAEIYARDHVPVADVESSFETQALDRYVGTRHGRVPLAVARTCRWTWACSDRYDDHTNSLGYRVIARSVLALLRSA
ncbi:MAG TPA: SGNH/GDSL hydrolase family protein [Thermoleophilaceae bacterium]|nr:SGNH/GDSL hydrolase family protein [Thermoleophilaceae bacterium]